MSLASAQSTKVLLIEKDPKMSNLVARFLSLHGFEVAQTYHGEHATRAFEHHGPAIAIIDMQLPDCDGLQICKDLRATSEVPILVLSAASDSRSHIQALESGADDYVVKSVQPQVLLARIRALLRRQITAEIRRDKLVLGALTIDRRSRSAIWDSGTSVPLTTTEFEILWVLANHAGKVLSREDLTRLTRGDSYAGHIGSKTRIDVCVCKLRSKLNEGNPGPSCIKTVWGQGYVFLPSLASCDRRMPAPA